MQLEETGPAFATAMRGYDRDQVDEYVTTVLAYADEAQERAVRAESALAQLEAAREVLATGSATTGATVVVGDGPVPHDLPERLGDAVRALLADGRDVAEQLVAQARSDRAAAAAELADGRARASAEATGTVTAASAEAAAIVQAARDEHARTVALTEEQVVALRQQADQQQARRDDVLRQLAALRALLAGASDEAVSGSSGETTAIPAAALEAVADALAAPVAAQPVAPVEIDLTERALPSDPDGAEPPAETTMLLLPREDDARVS